MGVLGRYVYRVWVYCRLVSVVGWGVLLEQVQLNFSFRNKFIAVLPCGPAVNNNTSLKCAFVKVSYWLCCLWWL